MLVKAQAPHYFKGASDMTFRRRLWLAMLQKRGNIEYNASEYARVWNAEYSQPSVRPYGDSGVLEFTEHDALQQFTVDVRGYIATDRLSHKKKLMNAGPQQLDNLYKEKTMRLAKRMRHQLCRELYIDGNASGNSNRFNGIESFLNDDGATVVADRVARPSDTYAGQSTVPGATGTWAAAVGTPPNATIGTAWPFGSGSSEYDWASPLLVNYGSTSFGQPSPSNTWGVNCEAAMRFAIINQINRGALEDDQSIPYIVLLSSELFSQYHDFLQDKQRIIVPHKESQDLGFGNTLNFSGSSITFESDVPQGIGYGIVPNQMELFLIHGQLIESLGPDFNLTSFGHNYLAYTFGNMRFQPKYFCKFKNYASS